MTSPSRHHLYGDETYAEEMAIRARAMRELGTPNAVTEAAAGKAIQQTGRPPAAARPDRPRIPAREAVAVACRRARPAVAATAGTKTETGKTMATGILAANSIFVTI